jgi:VWFA-related protein
MRSALTFFLAAVLMVAPLPAQQTPPAPSPPLPPPPERPMAQSPPGATIHATTTLILIDAEVTDKAGKPVKGLKREDFTLYEDGKEQSIVHFDFEDIERMETVAANETAPVVISLGGAAAPESIQDAIRDHRLIVLFFDLTSLQPPDLLRARQAAIDFVHKRMTPADLVGVVAFGNRLTPLANFTNDRQELERAIAQLAPGKEAELADMAPAAASDGEFASTEDTSAAFTEDDTEFNLFNTDRKLAAMQALADVLRGVPGKKAVLQFTSGITQTGEDNRTQLRAATEAANRANVAFYTVDSRGLIADLPGGNASTGAAAGTAMFSGATVYQQVAARQDSRDTLATLAADTGGRAFFDLGDLSKSFDQVQRDISGYYLLGYYSSNPRMDGRWRQVRVKVKEPGASLRYRDGYYAPKDYGHFTAEDRERQIEEAMESPSPRLELPLALETSVFRLSGTDVFVPLAAKLPSSALQWAEKSGRRDDEFDFAAEVRDAASGRPLAALRDTIQVRLGEQQFQHFREQALVYQGGFVLQPGNYSLKFLARENGSGRVGTFEKPLVVPPANSKRMELSSVLLSSQLVPTAKSPEVQVKGLGAGIKLDHSPLDVSGERIVPNVTGVFNQSQTLFVFFQAYLPPDTDPANVRAGLEWFRGGLRVNETPLVAPAEVDSKTRTASFRISLPVEKLAPGRYTVQGVAVAAGTQHAAFARAYLAVRPALENAPSAPTALTPAPPALTSPSPGSDRAPKP